MKLPKLLPFLLSLPAISGLIAQTEYKVYPGDTNNDGIVNVRDLLPIGLAYESAVDARADMGIDWSAKLAIDTLKLFLPNTLVNYVHINSNGDQIIDEDDMDAIRLNYDSTFTEMLPPWAPEVFAPVSYCPELRVYFDRDTAFLQDTFFAEIWLEFPFGEVVPDDGILGLAFSFSYPFDNINDMATDIQPNTAADVPDLLFVTANAQAVKLEKAIPPGVGHVGVAGRGFNALIKSLLICKVGIVVEDMIFRNAVDRPFWIDILSESVLIINEREERFEFCLPPSDTIILSDRISGLKAVAEHASIAVFPNPTTGSFSVELPEKTEYLRLYHTDGRLCWDRNNMSGVSKLAIDLPDLPPGSYVLMIDTPKTVFRKRLMLLR